MSDQLTLGILQNAIKGTAAAFRTRATLQPATGPGGKVFPPTYAGAKYAMETRRVNGAEIPCVLLDSVQSQANRHEEVLQNAIDAKEVKLPVVEVDFSSQQLLDAVGKVTSLTAPHRVADAILRDSERDGVRFRQTEEGKKLDTVSPQNATALYELCPTALIFGIWDSTGPKGGLGAKFQRAFVSEIVGVNAIIGKKTNSRIDPLQIRKEAGPIFRTADGQMTTNPDEAKKDESGKCCLYGKSDKGKDIYIDVKATKFPDEGNPSAANHGNVTPDFDKDKKTKQEKPGGVTIDYAEQTAVLSLPALRRLHFSVDGNRSPQTDAAGQTVLAALALYAAALANERGFDLRSRCLLWSETPAEWELLDRPGDVPQKLAFTAAKALVILKEAVAAAEGVGLKWRTEPLMLKPSISLAALVEKSQRISSAASEED